MARSAQTIWDRGLDILNTVRESVTKTILANLGDVVGGSTDSGDAEWWQHVGFISRPAKPKTTGGKAAAQAVTLRGGDRDCVIASRDLRGQELAGSLDYGETCIYAPGEDGGAQGRILLKKNGNVAIFTVKGTASTGTSCTFQVNSDGTIYVSSEFGGISIESGSMKILHSAGAGVTLDSSGVTALGQTILLNGGNVTLGNSSATPLAHAIPVVTCLTAATAALTAIAAGFTKLNTTSPAAEHAAAAAAATAASAVIGSTMATIPTTAVLGT